MKMCHHISFSEILIIMKKQQFIYVSVKRMTYEPIKTDI